MRDRKKTMRFAVVLAALILTLALSAAPALAKGHHHHHRHHHKAAAAAAAQASVLAQEQAARNAFLAGQTTGISSAPATAVGQECSGGQVLSLQCVLKDGLYILI